MKEIENKLARSRIVERIYLTGKLNFADSFHIGGSQGSLHTNKELLRDTGGVVFIPGSSIAGAIRDHLSRTYSEFSQEVDYYFGYSDKKTKQNSRFFVEDAYPDSDIIATTIRDGNAIAREYGSTRQGAKYDYEISPRGTVFSLHMMLELREKDENEKKINIKNLFERMVRDFEQGSVLIGGQKTRGLGRCRLTEYQVKSVRFPGQLKSFLLKGLADIPTISLESLGGAISTKEEDLNIKITFTFEEPVLVQDGMRAEADEFVEEMRWSNNGSGKEIKKKEAENYFVKVVTINGLEVPVIPGGSFKGIFRTRAEKIIRTLGGNACDPSDRNSNCSGKVEKVLREFKKKPDFDLEKENWIERWHSTICQNSCITCRLFGHSYLASRIFFSDSEIKEMKGKKYDGVAINRFTAGAMDFQLFHAVPLINGKGVLDIMIKKPDTVETALILFVLRDFQERTFPLSIGYGKNKGYGLLEAGEIRINGIDLHGFVQQKEAEGIFLQWKEKWENHYA